MLARVHRLTRAVAAGEPPSWTPPQAVDGRPADRPLPAWQGPHTIPRAGTYGAGAASGSVTPARTAASRVAAAMAGRESSARNIRLPAAL